MLAHELDARSPASMSTPPAGRPTAPCPHRATDSPRSCHGRTEVEGGAPRGRSPGIASSRMNLRAATSYGTGSG
jgi:hypothetical protein